MCFCPPLQFKKLYYMRGKVSGFKTLLRKEVPHLLNIDGDISHHIHNTAKKFMFPFGKYIRQLFSDIRADMQWSPDLQQYLAEICEILTIPYQTPADRIEHCWLSIYDAAVIDAPLFPALTIMYYAWTPASYHEIYKDIIDSLLRVSLKTCFFIINIDLCYLSCRVVEYVALCVYYSI